MKGGSPADSYCWMCGKFCSCSGPVQLRPRVPGHGWRFPCLKSPFLSIWFPAVGAGTQAAKGGTGSATWSAGAMGKRVRLITGRFRVRIPGGLHRQQPEKYGRQGPITLQESSQHMAAGKDRHGAQRRRAANRGTGSP